MTQITLEQLYSARDNFLSNIPPDPIFSGPKSIVTSAYHQEFPGVWVLVNELKRLNCQLPIEVFYRNGELSTQECQLLESSNPFVKTQLIKSHVNDFRDRYGHVKGWATKIYAILESKYQENLWIDCDNVPVKNPEFLFNDIEYQEKGSMFWRDIVSPDAYEQLWAGSAAWQVFNVPQNDSEPFEAGQFLINKSQCWYQLQLIKFCADNCNIYFQWGGDKDCWRWTWQWCALRQSKSLNGLNFHTGYVPYGFAYYGPVSKGLPNHYAKWGGGSVMVQRDNDGLDMFNHRTLAKFKISNNLFQPNIVNEEYYHQYLQGLAEIWSPQ